MRRVRVAVGRAVGVLVCLGLSWFGSQLWSQEGKGPSGIIRSVKSGPWSAATTWEGGKLPAAGAKVQIRPGHTVVYDVYSDKALRAIHVAGVLRFAHDKDTRLDVGLLRIQPGEQFEEEGFDCDHVPDIKAGEPRAALEVGSPDQPISGQHTALIRLVYFADMNKDSLPAIVACGGRMDFHGAPMNRTWVKLGATAKVGNKEVTLAEPVEGWNPGDRIILTATTRQQKTKKTFKKSVVDLTQTEERVIKSVQGTTLTLDLPLQFTHEGNGDYRGEVANLSRNVIVESADLAQRGHTMFHRDSSGAISYAEFRHLGKEGVLGRYSLHFHLVGDSMRGSYVIGASIWDSANRWLTIHGTNYLVVRDCVGYRSKGHGFFMEDGTEVCNILDRNLAVQALEAKPLPKQVIPFDKNDGSGFWWANSLNSFTRNVACDCDEYGYFFQGAKTTDFDPALQVLKSDGSRPKVDIRTLPFIRFEDNIAHCQRRHGFNLGGGVPFGTPNVDGIGPDAKHPFVIRNYKAFNVHWAIHPVSPSVMIDQMDIRDCEYGVWRPVYKDHAYRGINFAEVPKEQYYAFADGSPGAFPGTLQPVDDFPPVTVITHVKKLGSGKLLVRGSTADDGTVTKVLVNSVEARAVTPNFLEWEATLDKVPAGKVALQAFAHDAAGNVEKLKHTVNVEMK